MVLSLMSECQGKPSLLTRLCILQSSISYHIISYHLLSIQYSFINPKLYNGPGSITSKEVHSPYPNERSAFARCASVAAAQGLPTHNLPSATVIKTTLTTLQLGRYDPSSNISLIMQVEGKVPDQYSYVHFQFITRYVDPMDSSKLITRVATQVVSFSTDYSVYLDSLDEGVITILIEKEAAFRSMISRRNEDDDRFNIVLDETDIDECSSEAQNDLDATIHMISTSFRTYLKAQ